MNIVLKSKLCGLKVTDACVDYEGSITIDSKWMKKVGIKKYEQVHVLDKTNGVRLITYALKGGEGEVCINGAAAKKIEVGDSIIVLAFQIIDTGIKVLPKIFNCKCGRNS